MKICILISAVFLALFTGCSANYSIKNYHSNDKYYNEINNFIKNHSVDVILPNDSAICINNGALIENDSIYSLQNKTKSEYFKVPLSGVKDLFYTGSDYKSGDMIMNNNNKIKAVNIRILQDSIEFTGISTIRDKIGIAPVSGVKEIDYKNRWAGMIAGLGYGSVAGGIAVFFPLITNGFKAMFNENYQFGYKEMRPLVIGAVTLMGIGIVTGWIIGDNRMYNINR